MGSATMNPPILYHERALRSNARRRSFTLSEHYPAPLSCPLTLEQIEGVVEWLDVENSARWQPTSNATYCNVYAHDLLHVLGVYLPRLWWNDPRASNKEAIYGKNCHEMSANRLHDWMIEYGPIFGWSLKPSIKELHNPSQCGIIIARNKNRSRSGHVTVVLPEKVHAIEGEGPLQTQAGSINRKYFKNERWMLNPKYDSVVYALYRDDEWASSKDFPYLS